jgi:hypothetical protein
MAADFYYYCGTNSFDRIKSYFNKKVNFHNLSIKVFFQAIVEKLENLTITKYYGLLKMKC